MKGGRIEVAAAVLLNRGRIWIQRRQGTGHLDGLWEFPGGKVRPGEPPLEAVLREVREETGIDLPALSAEPLQSLDYSYPDRRLRLHFFLCRLDRPQAPCPSGSGLWVELADLQSYPFPPANRSVLGLLKDLRRVSRKAAKPQEGAGSRNCPSTNE